MIQESGCCIFRNSHFLIICTIFVIKLYILRKICKMNNLKPRNLFLFILVLRTFHYSIKKIMSCKRFLFPVKQFFVREIYKITYHIRGSFIATIKITFTVKFMRDLVFPFNINVVNIVPHIFIIPTFLSIHFKKFIVTNFQNSFDKCIHLYIIIINKANRKELMR